MVVEWTNRFADEALIPANHREAFVRSWVALVTKGEQFLWEDGGRPVSMAALRGWTRHGVRIAAVFTPREARGHGYASACVAALSNHALAAGRRFCALLTDMANPTSNRIYESVGYEKLYEPLRYAFA
jgi:predicted GNAT family acetyltransferase